MQGARLQHPAAERLCLFCCKVVAGLNWNCRSHELIQRLSNLQVHGMGWRRVGVSSPGRRLRAALLTPAPGQGVSRWPHAPHLQQQESRLHQPSPFCWVGSFLT